jgi:hypothetical protein
MDRYREAAFCVTLWFAVLTVIVAVLAITLNDLDHSVALLVAANVALLFAFVLMVRAARLTDSNIRRGQFWRALPAEERPRGEAGARVARHVLHETWLEFAKGAAAAAILLSSLAYASNGADQAKAARSQGMAMLTSQFDPALHRVVRLLPTN